MKIVHLARGRQWPSGRANPIFSTWQRRQKVKIVSFQSIYVANHLIFKLSPINSETMNVCHIYFVLQFFVLIFADPEIAGAIKNIEIMERNIVQTFWYLYTTVLSRSFSAWEEMFKLQSHESELLKSFSLLQNFHNSRPHITFYSSTR